MLRIVMGLALTAVAFPAAAMDCVHGTYPDGTEVRICTGGERSGRDAANPRHTIVIGTVEVDVRDVHGAVVGRKSFEISGTYGNE